jgi:hypothetical protein
MQSEQFHLPNKKALQSGSMAFEIILVDATEQSVERPQKNSGKKKCHAQKAQVIVIEHIFRKLKVFRMLKERCRNRRKRFGLRFSLIDLLHKSSTSNF